MEGKIEILVITFRIKIVIFLVLICSGQLRAQTIDDFYRVNDRNNMSFGIKLMHNTSLIRSKYHFNRGTPTISSFPSLGFELRRDVNQLFKLKWKYRSRLLDDQIGIIIMAITNGKDGTLDIGGDRSKTIAISNTILEEFNVGLNLVSTDRKVTAVGLSVGRFNGVGIYSSYGIGPYLCADYVINYKMALRLEGQWVYSYDFRHLSVKPELLFKNGFFVFNELLNGNRSEDNYIRNYIGMGWRF